MIWRRQWHPTPVFLPGESQGWGSLVGCSSWGRWESDTTEQIHFQFSNLTVAKEGMMLKLKLQYFGHLMRKVDSLEKTLMLGGTGGRGEGDGRR